MAIDLWYESTKRLEYVSRVFNPRPYDMAKCAAPNEFNLFHGFAIPRIVGDTPLTDVELQQIEPFLQHILTIWCKGGLDLQQYVLNWFAHVLQKPWEKTAVLLFQGGVSLKVWTRNFDVQKEPFSFWSEPWNHHHQFMHGSQMHCIDWIVC